MFNKEFLKTLTVLYVEDDESIRSSLSNILKKIFTEVIICEDGDLGVEQFKLHTQENKKIDVIISDINMPNKNGIEMVQEIRELDQDVPIIFTTAHGESEYLMEAINLKVSYYALKPINTTELLDNISKFCMIEHNKNVILEKSAQITKYTAIIDNIASIFKVDVNGNIVEVNDLMCEISEYSEDELINMHIDNILHQDTTTIKTFQDTLNLIENNDLFKAKLKCTSKSGGTFYLNSTIIISKNEYTEDIEEYIYICIDQTEDEIEKQQTMQRVRKNMILQRTKESELLKLTKELEKEIENIKASSISSKDTKVILASLAKEKQKVTYLNSQITHYEQEIVKLKKMQEKIDVDKKAKKLEAIKKQQDYLNEKEKFQSKIIELQALLSKQEAKLKALEIWLVSILPKHIFENEKDVMTSKYNKMPIGTGPYKLKELKLSQDINLEVNKNYFGEIPKIDTIRYKFTPDPTTSFYMLKQNQLDLGSLSPIQVNRQLDEKFHNSFNIYEKQSFVYGYMGFNLKNEKFKNKEIREAISLSIDRKEIIDILYFGHAKIANGPFLPGTFAFNEKVKTPQQNIKKAKELLRSYGYDENNPLEFEVITNANSATNINLAEIMQYQLLKSGIKMKIRVMEWQAFLNTVIQPRNFESIILAWSMGLMPDARSIWHSSSQVKGGYNFVGYENKLVDKLIEEGEITIDKNRLANIYKTIYKEISSDLPYLFLFIPNSITAVNKEIKNVTPALIGLTHNQEKWIKIKD